MAFSIRILLCFSKICSGVAILIFGGMHHERNAEKNPCHDWRNHCHCSLLLSFPGSRKYRSIWEFGPSAHCNGVNRFHTGRLSSNRLHASPCPIFIKASLVNLHYLVKQPFVLPGRAFSPCESMLLFFHACCLIGAVEAGHNRLSSITEYFHYFSNIFYLPDSINLFLYDYIFKRLVDKQYYALYSIMC